MKLPRHYPVNSISSTHVCLKESRRSSRVSRQVCFCLYFNCVGNDSYLAHVAWLCCSLLYFLRKFDDEGWRVIEQLLSVISKVTDAEITELKTQLDAMCKPLPKKDADKDDGAEQLCDCTFTLVYVYRLQFGR